MPDIIFTERFAQDLRRVKSSKMRGKILDVMDMLYQVPTMGSRSLPTSIIEQYGKNVRKLPVSPFLIICQTLDDGSILVLGMIHQKQAY